MLAESLLLLSGIYFVVGAVVAIAFVMRGISIVDPVAHGAPWSFHVLIFPGVAALWPLILQRWIAASRREGVAA